MTSLPLERWRDQEARLPDAGQAVIACADETSLVVYQAYRPAIAEWALEQGRLGGPHFSMTRMTWVKPSFLWMMYRCGWATKPDQERVLAVRVARSWFAETVADAVLARFHESTFTSEAEWKQALAISDVRVQWDPDRLPDGGALRRRAIQVGLRRKALDSYLDAIEGVHDVGDLVAAGRVHASAGSLDQLDIPVQDVLDPL